MSLLKFLRRLTRPQLLSALILPSMVVVLTIAVVKSQAGEPNTSGVSATHAEHSSTDSATASTTTQGGEPSHTCGTPYDTIPNFAFNPTLVSVQDGPWSSPSTWSLGRVPEAQDIIVLHHQVTYDSQTGIVDVIGIYGGASLRFRTDRSTKLQVGVLKVFEGGTLTIGTSATPVAPTVTAELIIRNRPLNLTTDPDQFGTGLLSHNGTVTMHGAVKAPTFVRTAAEPRAGHTTLSLEQPVSGWRVGDRIFVPDTRQVHPDNWFNQNWPLQMEERGIQSISADSRTITLSSALSFDHRGARNADGTPTVLSNGIKLLPHVGNLTRNVIIRSENPSGTRGHTLFTLRSAVNLRYVQFQDLGRTKAEPLHATTNHIGRYPLHMHQLWGPVNPSNTGYQFQLIGNAINDSMKWPIAVHGSHFGLIRQNVIYGGSQLTGAGIAVEDGSETENLFEENFVANIRGDINPRNSGPSTEAGSTPGSAAECFWAAGFNNRFVNNVASGCRNPTQQIVSGPGWKFIVPAAPFTARNPLFRGADMTNYTQTRAVTPQYQPILEFRSNEVYGLAADGLTAWQLGLDGDPGVMPESLIKDFRVWHTYEGAIYNYPANRMTIEDLVYRIDPAVTVYWQSAFQCGDYRNLDITVRGGSIHAGSIFGGCVDPLGTYRFENIDAVTRNHAFGFETPATPGTQQDRPPSGVTMILRNNTIRAWPGQPLRTIEMDHNLSRGNSQPGDNYDVLVFDYQGQVGNDFQVYFGVQASQNLYGGLAPCNNTTTRPEINGITCGTGTPTPTPTPTPNPTPTPTPAPVLLTEENAERAIALDSVIMMRDPFPVANLRNFSVDQRTRVTLFALNVDLLPGEDFSVVTAQAEDPQSGIYTLAVESVRKVPNFEWLTQITLRLPDEMRNAGDMSIFITFRGRNSNSVTLTIPPEGVALGDTYGSPSWIFRIRYPGMRFFNLPTRRDESCVWSSCRYTTSSMMSAAWAKSYCAFRMGFVLGSR